MGNHHAAPAATIVLHAARLRREVNPLRKELYEEYDNESD